MATIYRPAPSIESLVSHCVKWLALNLRARVTVEVYKSNDEQFTESYDARLTPSKQERK